jgi:hypothetical protein
MYSILFSKNDTLMDNTLALAALHSGGFTQKDLQKLFENEQNYSDILEDLLKEKGAPTPWMTSERRKKILDTIATIDIPKLETTVKSKNIDIITIESARQSVQEIKISLSSFWWNQSS